jgi:hypothetical protein
METYRRAGAYDGDVLFENLELVRTIRALGGREELAGEIFVLRRPPTAAHFWGQRVRQAYDEFARPARLAAQLALAPLLAASTASSGASGVAAFAGAAIALAELGRRQGDAARVFPLAVSLCAPLWVTERAVTVWIALALRCLGGVRYANGRLRRAAHSERELRRRFAA